jgi:glycosyltransferase involved in cell wall biosynthesis
MTRVAVIVPAFNYGRFLVDALDSVAAQTHLDWECIVVDDGSTDDTEAVARRYAARDSRFRYLRQENRGVSAARNSGLRESSAPYVQFLDADDRLAPAALERHVAWLEMHPEVDIVYGQVTFFRTEDPERVLYSLDGHLSKPLMDEVQSAAGALEKLQHYNILPINGALLRRGVFDRAGFFDEKARASEDWAFWIRCAAAGCEIAFDGGQEAVAMVRTHPGSLSRDRFALLRGLIESAHSFEANPSMRGKPLPLIYDVVLGIEMAERGARLAGSRRMRRAAARASERLTAIRWRIYALFALFLPRRLFMRAVSMPVPERAFEWYRRVRRFLSR